MLVAKKLKKYLVKNSLVGGTEREASAPTNSPCTDEEHAAMQGGRTSVTDD